MLIISLGTHRERSNSMSNVNLVALSGRAYSKRTNKVGNNLVVNFVIRQFARNKNGEELVDFIPVEAWNKLAEHIDKKFEEGMIVSIQGTIKPKKDKNNHTYIVIKVEDFDGFSLTGRANGNENHYNGNDSEDNYYGDWEKDDIEEDEE